MLYLNRETIKETSAWEGIGIQGLGFDYERMVEATRESPTWIHFGAGNIFRGFIAMLQQKLLDTGYADTGIIAAETYDHEIVDKIYKPYDNLGLLAIMNSDGSLEKKIIGSISESLVADISREKDWRRLQTIFSSPSLQVASFTITEKGYKLTTMAGDYIPEVKQDMVDGPHKPASVMAKITALAYTRYKSGKLPIAFVSMDNCSHNGDKLYHSVLTIAQEWVQNGLVEEAFLGYINNREKVAFPWSMIDKITPRPADSVRNILQKEGFGSTEILYTNKHTYIAPFVNAERPQYLVIEDTFPNGRMPLEKAGVFFTDRETVDRVEKMKVCTCLNPLHTSLAVFGCLLGYTLIADEMDDPDLKKLIEKVGEEGMPVVVNPGILDPKEFLREVVTERFPNPYIPDTPQRIATDTSQKVGIRFGETMKAYCQRDDLSVQNLTYIPLVIAAWCRYLMGIDDRGNAMNVSPDPLLNTLQSVIAPVKLGGQIAEDRLRPILSNRELFGIDLYTIGLGSKVEGYFSEMIAGIGAVRATLQRYL